MTVTKMLFLRLKKMKMMKILKEREVRKFQQRKVERGEKTVKMKMK